MVVVQDRIETTYGKTIDLTVNYYGLPVPNSLLYILLTNGFQSRIQYSKKAIRQLITNLTTHLTLIEDWPSLKQFEEVQTPWLGLKG